MYYETKGILEKIKGQLSVKQMMVKWNMHPLP